LTWKANNLKYLKILGAFFLVGIMCLFALKIVFSNTFLQSIANEKICIHRVNSVEKLKEVRGVYTGVELDVVFDNETNTFDVNHPPAKSINLSLENYLKEITEFQNLRLWLDVKNLNDGNVDSIIKRLNFICKSLNIQKERIIVESPSFNDLLKIKTNNYIVSYYLPWPGLYTMEQAEMDKQVSEILKKIDEAPSVYLSSDYRDYELMKKYFPKNEKLFWITKEVSSFSELTLLSEILSDDKVKVLLVQHEAKVENR